MSKSRRRTKKTKKTSAVVRSRNRVQAGMPESIRGLPRIDYSKTGLPKMSETLIAFAEPYLDYGHGLTAFRNGVSLAAIAWNVALFPASERNEQIEFLVQSLGRSLDTMDRVMLHATLHEMVLRKDMLFASDRRMIASYDVCDNGDEYYVNVASVLSGPVGASDE